MDCSRNFEALKQVQGAQQDFLDCHIFHWSSKDNPALRRSYIIKYIYTYIINTRGEYIQWAPKAWQGVPEVPKKGLQNSKSGWSRGYHRAGTVNTYYIRRYNILTLLRYRAGARTRPRTGWRTQCSSSTVTNPSRRKFQGEHRESNFYQTFWHGNGYMRRIIRLPRARVKW